VTANSLLSSCPDPVDIVAAAILELSSRVVPIFVGEGEYGAILDAMGETTNRHFHIPTTAEKALTAEDLEYLKSKGCFTLPADSKELLKVYFEFVHPTFPVVDRSLFLQNYAVGGHEGINLLLLWSMFSVSASYSSISSRKSKKRNICAPRQTAVRSQPGKRQDCAHPIGSPPQLLVRGHRRRETVMILDRHSIQHRADT
jgi:hypothetical protein